jgi:hypothetical protein
MPIYRTLIQKSWVSLPTLVRLNAYVSAHSPAAAIRSAKAVAPCVERRRRAYSAIATDIPAAAYRGNT